MKKPKKQKLTKEQSELAEYTLTINAQIKARYIREPGHTCKYEDVIIDDTIRDIQKLNTYAYHVLGLRLWFDDDMIDIERDGIPTYAHPGEKKPNKQKLN